MCQYCQPLIKAIDGYLQKANDNLAATLKTVGFEAPKKTVKYINSIEDAVAEALKAETDYIVAEAEKAGSLFEFAAKWQKIKDGDALDAAIADIFAQNFEEFVPAYVKRYMAETDPELAYGKVKKDATADRISNKTSEWIQSWSGELGSMMKLNSSNEIEDILTTGLQSGEGVAWFTQQLMESGIRDEYYKARRVAVTEVLRAHSVAQQEAFMQDPSVEKKKWRHSGSYRNSPRQNHVDMDGQIVAKDEPYTLYGADGGIYYPMYPRDSSLPAGESINCHCISQPVADEEILGMSLEEREQLRQEAIDSMDDEWEKERDAENRTRAGVAVQQTPSITSVAEYLFVDHKAGINTEAERKAFTDAYSTSSQKVQDAMSGTTVNVGRDGSCAYDYKNDTMYIAKGATKEEAEHEIGHLVESKLMNKKAVNKLKQKFVTNVPLSSITQETYYDTQNNPVDIFVVSNDDFVSPYQGRLYVDDWSEIFDKNWKIKPGLLKEFISEPYRIYRENPEYLKENYPDFYKLIEEAIK